MAPKVTKNICNNCNKDVVSNDRDLSCSICDKWFHIKYERVPVTDYDFLQKSDDSIHWVCKGCKGTSQKICKMLTLMHTRQDKIETEVVGLKHCNKRMNSVDKNVSQLNEILPKMVSQQISQIIDDKSEQEKREANVIIFGISVTEEGDSKVKDTEFIQGLCSDSLGIDNIAIDEITRLDAKPKKGSGKFRLTKLVVKDNTSRNNLFCNAYKLKDTKIGAHKKIGIGRDLTKKQREINNALRIELGQMKKDFPHRS
ncbi:Hypothetical predicted protein [Mytilus galloprovincialis]|uniref:PHD-type domain-containing protein n=1 Tax=Mytilus galloprovincialis TaxID=29158 RepID=A0A8B6H9I0_MYTGA|nr:Hypothetical predicted protein [Mytilus galloprovincialis]